MRLKRSEDVSMSRLSRIKSTEEDHDQSNLVCGELKDKLKVTAHPVVTIGKLLQKRDPGNEVPILDRYRRYKLFWSSL